MQAESKTAPVANQITTWQITPRLRWRGSSKSTTEPRVLEQAHCCMETGEVIWQAYRMWSSCRAP